MGIGIVIIVQLFVIAIIGSGLGLFVLLMTYILATKERYKQGILHFFLTLIFLFSLYFSGLLGMGMISSIKNYDIGIGDYFTVPLTAYTQFSMIDTTNIAYLEKDGTAILHSIIKVAETEQYYYFEVKNHQLYSFNCSNEQLIEVSKDLITTSPLHWDSTETFYYDQRRSYWPDGLIVGILALFFSGWICLRIRRFVMKKGNLFYIFR